MRLQPILFNSATRNHRHPIKQAIRVSDDIFFAVAFLKQSGLSQIIGDIKEVLQRGATFNAVIGTDFWLTDPEALESLFRLQTDYATCKLHIFKSSAKSTFHPKYYRFKTGSTLRLILGSANLTDGGLATNIEVSSLHECSDSDGFAKGASEFEHMILNDPRCLAPTYDDLLKYQSEHSIFQSAHKKAERSARKEIAEIVSLDEVQLRNFLAAYKNDARHQTDLQHRKTNYADAQVLLNSKLLSPQNLSMAEFREIYGQLVGARGANKLWHSGSVHRLMNKIIPQHALMQSMVRDIGRHLDLSPGEMYELGQTWMEKIQHFGPNVFTEICNTLRPEKFAVLNNNPTTSLRKLGRGSFPSPGAFTPADYEKYCEVLDRLRDACGFKDFGETDHFLNYVYWKTKKIPAGASSE